MMKKSLISRTFSLSIALAGCILASGYFTDVNAQGRDPFVKPGYARTRTPAPGGGSGRIGPAVPVAPLVPSIEQRIEFYKRMREEAAAGGAALPKVTSVLTLDEMAVTGIFRTPRGYAAMVEAMPIKLSYTIYPGEKFFDGQLVAVEENRLVFRKVSKTGKGKFVSSVENKPLRKYSTREQIQGTVPAQVQADAQTEPAPMQQAENKPANAIPVKVVSPLDEMNQSPSADEKSAKSGKKPVKVANNKK